MWLFEVSCVLHVIAVCAAQDVHSGFDRESVTGPQEMTTTTYEPPTPVLQRRTNWSQVFPSEKVELGCSVGSSSSDFTFTWYRNKEKLTAGPNLSFNGDGSVLTIDATAKDAGSYSCKGNSQHGTGVSTTHSNLLDLSVHGKIPKPKVAPSLISKPLFYGEKIKLTCKVEEFDGGEYLWFHNGQRIGSDQIFQIESVDQGDNGSYYCKVNRGAFSTEDSETVSLQVFDLPTPVIKQPTPCLDVFKEEPVEFSCNVEYNGWTYTWYKDGVKLDEDDIMTVDEENGLLNITSVNETHHGEYSCKAHLSSRRLDSKRSNSTRLTVYENTPKPTLSKDPAFNPMFVGETVNFTCGVSVSSGWKYQWYKDGNRLADTGEALSVNLGSDGGRYSCMALRGGITSTSRSEEVQQDVLEIPVPSLERAPKWENVFPNEMVRFQCGIQNSSGWSYKWYKDGKPVQADSSVSLDSYGATLSIDSTSAEHQGRYECRGNLPDRDVSSNYSSQVNLVVYDKKPTVTVIQDPKYTMMFSQESTSFTCHIDVSSEWEYIWYKEGNILPASRGMISLKPIKITDSGSYKCRARRGINKKFITGFSQAVQLQVRNKKPKPVITQQPNVDKLYTGESVYFTCNVKGSSGWKYSWYKDQAPLLINSSSFTVDDVSVLNSGTYQCKAKRDKTGFRTEMSDRRTLEISEIPVPFLRKQELWLDVFPHESVEFSCRMGVNRSNWQYEWYKDTEKIKASDNDGTTLLINASAASDRGKYKCLGQLRSRMVRSNFSSPLVLDVYDSKPVVTLVQNPTHEVMHTGDSVSFYCHINVSTGWEYVWYKETSPFTTSGNYHNMSSVMTTNTGSYKCEVERGMNPVPHSYQSRTIKLDVKERPQAAVVLLTGWSEVFSTDSLTLKCEVTGSPVKWNYTWFKEGQPIEGEPTEKYKVTPQNDPVQSLYTCQGIRSGRPAYSKTSESMKTKNLLVKRRVLLSISGVIFFSIIGVFLACIVCKFVRKPAEEKEEMEEVGLHPTIALLKGFNNVQSPLAEYITDASLNGQSKAAEAEENGIISSETTPLPITSLENAEMISSPDQAENNGVLHSFQH